MKSWHLLTLATAILALSTLLPPTVSAYHTPTTTESSDETHVEFGAQRSQPNPPNPAAAASKSRVLMVTGALEHFALLSGSLPPPFSSKVLDLTAEADGYSNDSTLAKSTFIRLFGMAVCLDKEKLSNASMGLDGPVVQGTVRMAALVGRSVNPQIPVTDEGMFFIPIEQKATGPDSEQYLLFTHNCTDSGKVIVERFNLSSFAEQKLYSYTTLTQGHLFLPVSSHDAALTHKVAEMLALISYFSRYEKESVPKALFVEGESRGSWYSGESDIRVVGRLYNWDYESMPQPGDDAPPAVNEQLLNRTKVPLSLDGRVTMTTKGNAACSGVKLGLYRGDRKVMSGSTHSADSPFRMYAEDGGLLEVVEPLSDWLLVVEHSCNRGRELRRQKFRLASKPLEGDYFKAAKLEPVS